MKYIDRDTLVGDPTIDSLIEAAETARQEISLTTDQAERDRLIERHRQKWVAFRAPFEVLSYRKCWYTESRNPGTDDDVDHFRPKGRIADDQTHGGYWWEAFNWRNFRLSCHRANRLRVNPDTEDTHGKGDHFPLVSEGDRCRTPQEDLARERPLLLDPTDPFDPPLLTFSIDGTVALAPEYVGDAVAARRVDASRVYLHLEWPAFTEDRQRLYSRIRTKVEDGNRQEARLIRGEVGAKEALMATARDLIHMTRGEQPYSRAARAYIALFRTNPWVGRAVWPHCS